jgi:hypothetical protein
MYRNSIQWYIDQWLRMASDKFGWQKNHTKNTHTHGKKGQKKNEDQEQQQSKSHTENKKHKDEKYFEMILGLLPSKPPTTSRTGYRKLVMQYLGKSTHLGPK